MEDQDLTDLELFDVSELTVKRTVSKDRRTVHIILHDDLAPVCDMRVYLRLKAEVETMRCLLNVHNELDITQ